MPPQEQTPLSDNQEALIELGFDFARRIKDPAVRNPLVRPAANKSDEARAQLAIEQLQSFLYDQAKTPLPLTKKATAKKVNRKAKPKRASTEKKKKWTRARWGPWLRDELGDIILSSPVAALP